MQSPLNITISASIQTPAFPQCSAANCSLHSLPFSRRQRLKSTVPKTPVKETLALDQFTHTHTNARRTAGGHDLRSAHAYIEQKHILFLSSTTLLSSFSHRHRHLVNQAVNWSLLLKQSQDKGSLSESTLQHLYGASREHESINRRITLEMLINSPHTP